jgi:ornithine--oxo-acid transaminase
LQVIVDEDLPARSAELGEYALNCLKRIRSPHIVEIRGKGLWIGIELNTQARPFCETLKQRGVLCKETHASVIRLAPPLVIEKADLDWGLEHIRAVLEEAAPESSGKLHEAAVASSHS